MAVYQKPKRDTFQDLMTILGIGAQAYGAWNQGQQFQQVQDVARTEAGTARRVANTDRAEGMLRGHMDLAAGAQEAQAARKAAQWQRAQEEMKLAQGPAEGSWQRSGPMEPMDEGQMQVRNMRFTPGEQAPSELDMERQLHQHYMENAPEGARYTGRGAYEYPEMGPDGGAGAASSFTWKQYWDAFNKSQSLIEPREQWSMGPHEGTYEDFYADRLAQTRANLGPMPGGVELEQTRGLAMGFAGEIIGRDEESWAMYNSMGAGPIKELITEQLTLNNFDPSIFDVPTANVGGDLETIMGELESGYGARRETALIKSGAADLKLPEIERKIADLRRSMQEFGSSEAADTMLRDLEAERDVLRQEFVAPRSLPPRRELGAFRRSGAGLF